MFTVAGVLMLSTCTAILYFYAAILRRLRRVKHQAAVEARRRRHERKLLAMSAIVCSMQLVDTAYVLFKVGAGIDKSNDIYNFLK